MIPIRTDRRQEHTPWVNYALILANVLVFVVFQGRRSDTPLVQMYMLHSDQPQLYQFFSSMFMHAGWAHLIGNMIFLWVFGNAVNDSFGHVGYLAFYLAGGIVAGVGYVLLSGAAPVLGASGAISAVTGAFLVLFPRVRVTVLIVLIWVLMPIEISSLFFLGLQFVWQIFNSLRQAGGIAYVAHASGYVFGIGLVAVLLWARLLPRDVYDMLTLLRTWHRRRGYRQAVSHGYDPFNPAGTRVGGGGTSRRWVSTRTVASDEAPSPSARELQLRRQIAADHAQGNFAAAAQGYLQLVQVAEDALLPLNQQLDVANYLMSAEQYTAAADAYERFCRHYGNYEYLGDVRLMLGLIYSRYLHQDERAEYYLSRAISQLRDERKLSMARAELEQVRRRRR